THISVVDKYGNAVALTQTLSSFFGAGVAVPDTGIILNNQMQNFNAPGHPNELVPGKRPRTIIAPTIVLKDGKPFLVVGSPGAALQLRDEQSHRDRSPHPRVGARGAAGHGLQPHRRARRL